MPNRPIRVSELRLSLTVSNFDEAVNFYRDTLNFQQLEDWSSDEGRVILLDAGRATLELLDERQAEFVDQIETGARVSEKVRIALQVEDSDQAAARLVEAGGEEVATAKTTPWGDRNARVSSPDGMQITLFSTS